MNASRLWDAHVYHKIRTHNENQPRGTNQSHKKHSPYVNYMNDLTHWGWVTHICISKLNITCSNNGLSPGRRQAIIWTNAGILLIGPLGTHFNQILTEIYTFSWKKIHLKISGKWRPFCLGLNVLMLLSLVKEIWVMISRFLSPPGHQQICVVIILCLPKPHLSFEASEAVQHLVYGSIM